MHEFFQRVQEFGTPGPEGKKTYPVIRGNRDHLWWLAWICYFERVGLPASVQEMHNGYDTGMSWTVPTIDPAEFDPAIVISDADIRAKREYLDPPRGTPEERRAFAQKMIDQVRAKLKTMPGSRPVDKRGDDLKQMRNAILSGAGKSVDDRRERDRRIQEHAERKAAEIAMKDRKK